MRDFSEHERKVFRRLRQAYRRGILVVMAKKGSPDDGKKAMARITARAVRLGWLELPKMNSAGGTET